MIGKKDDWFEKQVDIIAKTIIGLIFGKEKLMEIIQDREETNDIQTKANEQYLSCVIEKLLRENKINEAEDLLFEEIKKDPTPGKLEIAAKFYDTLNKYDDQKLSECNFSHDEIIESVNELKKIYTN